MALLHPLPIVPKANEVVPMMEGIISRVDVVLDNIVGTITHEHATFETVVHPYAAVHDAVQGDLCMLYMLQYGSPSLNTQKAFKQAQRLYLEAEARWSATTQYFSLLRAAHLKKRDLEPEQKLLLETELAEYMSAGHGVLADDDIRQFLETRNEISFMEADFRANIAGESGGIWLSDDELKGLPPATVSGWKGSNGKRFVRFANGGTIAVLTYASRSEARKKIYLANEFKLSSNGLLLNEIVQRRFQQAKVLGYENHAAFKLQRRMAKTTKWVDDFLGEVREGLVPRGKAELEVLQRRRHLDGEEGPFPPWDQLYYQRLAQEEVQVDQVAISEYFPLESSAAAMLDIFASFLGLRFEAVPAESLTPNVIWHDKVTVFSVRDESEDSSNFLGYIYLDLLWREHKYRGNHNVNVHCGYEKADGTRQHVCTILMCSFPTPSPGKPALLKHPQIITLFHEMGHAIHDLVAKTKYTRFHGTRLPRDIGEMPSTMLENFCWDADILTTISCHYTTLSPSHLQSWRAENPGAADPPKQIPLDMVERLTKSRYLNRGLYHLWQLSISIFDMKIHSIRTPEELQSLNLPKLWYETRQELEGLDYSSCSSTSDFYGFGHFAHLVSDMDAGYYSYLCCATIADDVFQTMFAKDIHDSVVWDRYRREILQYGGSHPDMLQMLEDFLGRPPRLDALVSTLEKHKVVST